MKRFWKEVAVDAVAHGHAIALDGRRVRTPARAELVVASPALAEAIAGEWRECGATVDPRTMPLTGLANAAIDRVGVDCGRFAAELARFGEGDLLCYRADHPARLVALQAATWDPLLDWARGRFECDFTVTDGIIHRAQPPATVKRLAAATAAMGAFTLAGLAPLVTIGGRGSWDPWAMKSRTTELDTFGRLPAEGHPLIDAPKTTRFGAFRFFLRSESIFYIVFAGRNNLLCSIYLCFRTFVACFCSI